MKTKVAVVGIKGFPSNFVGTSGVETYVEQIIRHSRNKNLHFNCYVRTWAKPKKKQSYPNVTIVKMPTIKHKILDPLICSFLSSLFVCFTDSSIVWYHAIGTSFFSFLPRIFGKKIILTIHGLDWQRSKWNWLEQKIIKFIEILILNFSNQVIVVSESLKDYFRKIYHKTTIYIPPGMEKSKKLKPEIIGKKFHLKESQYILFLGRVVPEKRIEWLISAFEKIPLPNLKLVIAGGESNTKSYEKKLRDLTFRNNRIIWTGYVFDREKKELLSNCLLFVLPSSIEGNPIVLMEVLGYNKYCLVAKENADKNIINIANILVFQKNDYQDFLRNLTKAIKLTKKTRIPVNKNLKEYYAWPTAAQKFEKLFF